MSTTVAEAPTPVVAAPTNAEVAAAETVSWARRTYENVKDTAVRGWNAFLRGLRWVKDKIVAAARWVKEKTVAAGKWIGEHAKSAWAWMKDAAIGAWEFTAPFRHWVATPFRLALTTTGGLAALLLFGGKIIVGLTVIWLVYLLVSGRLQMTEKVNIPLDKDGRMVLSAAQKKALEDRHAELKAREAAADDTNARLMANLQSRISMVSSRMDGDATGPNKLAETYMAIAKKQLSPAMFKRLFDPREVKKAFNDEHRIVNDLLTKAAGMELATAK